MTSVFQLYGRPLAENEPLPPLRITGVLASYAAGDAYEGRLQIIDSIGKCKVEIVESDLPPGAYAFVDNFTKEIVLRWPPYSPPEVPSGGVHNGDFELGDDGSWRFGAGWSIEAGGAETGTYSGVFQNQRGTSSIASAPVPYVPGQTINASCRFQRGASSSGNLVGRILLVWYDANGRGIPGGEGITWTGGTLIRSGSGGEWQTSSVTGSSNHPDVAQVSIGFSANRKKQNRLARVDNFTWDHTYSVGTVRNLDFTVTFKVTDSANRVAYWSGFVTYDPFFVTSTPYVVVFEEHVGVGHSLSEFEYKLALKEGASSEPMGIGFNIQGWEFFSNTDTYTQNDPIGVQFTLQEWIFRDLRKFYTEDENTGVQFTLQGFTIKPHPAQTVSENTGVQFTLQGFTIT